MRKKKQSGNLKRIPKTRPRDPTGGGQNRLAGEKSPYLLQHADIPVDWFPWGAEAFQRAKEEDKPVFLSIGYSTCHWCHVMEHESFENPEVAELMNNAFISIKVDREERPDIDNVYMAVCQAMTGSGGWPLTIIMTPDRKPFFAATYIPKEQRFGRVGLLELIPRIEELWTTRRTELDDTADQIVAALQQTSQQQTGDRLGQSILMRAYDQLADRFDEENGGFGEAPKFPIPHNLSFLLRFWKRTGDEHALHMVDKTLQKMRQGGIYDHLGFGFHRYSTDSQWLVPHFEKMLYDQAMSALAYTEAYQATGREEYAKTVHEILNYVLTDMRAETGGFHSAEDADTEGEEGRFYLWTYEELRKLLTEEEFRFAAQVFSITKSGNLRDAETGTAGKNVLHLRKPHPELSSDLKMSTQAFEAKMEAIRRKLRAARDTRTHPHQDDKILTDWNGLMIAALAKASQAFSQGSYTEAARDAADFILKEMRTPDEQLLHRYRDGEVSIAGHLDDYAFLIWGLLELYEDSLQIHYLKAAVELNTQLMHRFWDKSSGGFFFTAEDAETLLVRQKVIYDGAVPSGNSVAMLNLLRIGRILGNADLEQKAARIGSVFSGQVASAPSAYAQLMVAVDFSVGPSYEVIIAGKRGDDDTEEMLNSVRTHFIPNKILIFRPDDEELPKIDSLTDFVKYHTSIDRRATAYVCVDYTCEFPTTEISKMLELLGVRRHIDSE